MMSSFNTHSDQFEPIAVNSLENFDQERSNRTQTTKPDFDRFKVLFETQALEENPADKFKELYDTVSQEEDVVFKSLFGTGEDFDRALNPEESNEYDEISEDLNDPEMSGGNNYVDPEETFEERGYKLGFEKGVEQGQEKGFEEGLKKGEERGFEQGEKKGVEQGLQQGIEQGLIEGQEQGEAKVKEEANEIVNSLGQSLKIADQTLDLIVDKYETNILSLIKHIVEKIIMAKIEIDDEFVKPVIIDALKTLVQAENVVLSVSEDDYEYIEMVQDDFFNAVDSLSSVSVKSDSSIKKGGCKIETNTAAISSDIESRLEAVFDAIKKVGAL